MFLSIFLIYILQVLLVKSRLPEDFEFSDANVDDNHKWAVLVAGSKGFYNYRHQADVCHAYHVLRSKGIKPEHIITFMYDDIAHNEDNPFKGKIFNDYHHKDYYKGVVIDYKHGKVNPKTFLQVLKGDKRAGKKVLNSGKNDDVFIYFTDHGSPGSVEFPEDELTAKELINTLKYMHKHKRYSKLVFYIEACESGSMFSKILPSNMNIYATTAANPRESSWATFCSDPQISTCLADLYSYDWIVDSEKHELTKRSLDDQFKEVRRETDMSHVQRYGDSKLGKLKLSEFQGSKKKVSTDNNTTVMKPKDSMPSRDVPIHTLRRQIMMTNDAKEKKLLTEILSLKIKRSSIIQDTMDLIVEVMKTSKAVFANPSIDDILDCAESVYNTFKRNCFTRQQAPEVSGHLSTLYNYCENGYTPDVINRAITKICN
uniref:Hemoglobinase n=1 Tax=Trichobilharzia regenti TaxID=157069 RepID=A0AA85JQL8_TRIRE|nr:unnamed protein product [Trichobilharzia regenti]